MDKQQIRKIREQLGLSQRDFADKLEITQKTVWHWEAGKSKPSTEYEERLTTLFQSEVVKGSQTGSQSSQNFDQQVVKEGSQGSQKCTNVVDTGSQNIVKSDNEGNQGSQNVINLVDTGSQKEVKILEAGSQGSQNEVVKVVKNDDEVVKTGSQNHQEVVNFDDEGSQDVVKNNNEGSQGSQDVVKNDNEGSQEGSQNKENINGDAGRQEVVNTGSQNLENVSIEGDTKLESGENLNDDVSRQTGKIASEVIIMADELRKAGISVLITDAVKRPVGKGWKKFQTTIPTRDELEVMCNRPSAVGVATIGGNVSGGLETIDFEGIKKVGKCCFHDWENLIKSYSPDLFARLVINSTPNEGYHVRYRYQTEIYDTKLDLARIPHPEPTTKVKTLELVETRGEAHYALCPPSPGYKIIQGQLTSLPVISLEERNFLIDTAKSFNEIASGKEYPENAAGLKPGQDFNQRGNHRILLEKHGWQLALQRENGIEYWRRPGKDESWSATWNFIPGRFYPFSTNAEPFEEGKIYDRFAIYAYLEYQGDFKEAARALNREGYGEHSTQSTKTKTTTEYTDYNDEESGPPFTIRENFTANLTTPSFPAIAWRSIWEDFRLAHTNTTEAPDEFLFASVSAVVGAVMGRKAWVWYARRMYPNFYFSIVGTTARTRKTTGAEKACDLLTRVDPNVLYYRGLASAEGFIQLLSPLHEKDEAEFDSLLQDGKMKAEELPGRYKAGKARLAERTSEFEGLRMLGQIGEFSSLLKKSSRESTQGLTEALIDAYDNPLKLDNPTRTSPLSATKPSVSILTTTTKGRLFRHLMKEEIEGGFANRFAYFIGDRKQPIPLPPEPIMEHLNKCVARLAVARQEWQNTQFHLLSETARIWDEYYRWWFHINDGDTIDQFTGRLPDHAMKLALQYAIVENETPEILPDQMEAAIAVSKYWHEGIRALFTGFGLTENQQVEQSILEATSNGGKGKEELYDYFSRNIDARTLNNALENLQKVGKIVQEKQPQKGRGRPKVVFRLATFPL